MGLAWGLDGRAKRPAKTVLRAGFGIFYDRIPLTVTLNALRYNGVDAAIVPDPQSRVLSRDPAGRRVAAEPAAATVTPGCTAECWRRGCIRPAWASSANSTRRRELSVTWIHSRGVHLLNLRNINAPIDGSYPAGDRSIRLLTESAGAEPLESVGGRLRTSTTGS